MEYLERDKAQIKLTNLPILIGSKARNRLVDMAYSISAYLKRRRQQKIDRAAFNNMLLLDDNILKDIGVEEVRPTGFKPGAGMAGAAGQLALILFGTNTCNRSRAT